jgi:hypothetical protein
MLGGSRRDSRLKEELRVMATGRTPDASETKRAEDSIQAGYDKNGKRRDFLTKDLVDGKLPPGYVGTPPAGTHPNDPNPAETRAARAAAQAEEERAAAAAAAEQQKRLREQQQPAGKSK